MQYPSDAEIDKAASVIGRLPKGRLPYPLFIAIASKIVTPTVELVIINKSKGKDEIILARRTSDDEHWPGQWHIPGTVILSTDTEDSYESCFDRVLKDELYGLIEIAKPRFVSLEFWDIERGRELDQLFCANLLSMKTLPDDIRAFPVDSLPDNLMPHHSKIISKVMAYRSQAVASL